MLLEKFKWFYYVHRHHIAFLLNAFLDLVKAHFKIHHWGTERVDDGVVLYFDEVFLELGHSFAQIVGETIEGFPIGNQEAP